MMGKAIFSTALTILLVAMMPGAFAAESCPVEGAEAISDALDAAPTCKAAAKLLDLCSFASTIDVQFSETVIDKCEKDFLSTLPKDRLAAYHKERAACDRKYAHKEGSMYVGFTAVCNAHVAAKYSGR